ncbi:MAG: hypothetical protein ACLRWQ_03900 [Flavonifractor plautii]
MIYDEFTSKEHEILTGIVTRIDPQQRRSESCASAAAVRVAPRPSSAPASRSAGRDLPGGRAA